MLSFAYLWVFAFLPLPWLLRAILPAQRRRQTSVRVPFGSRLREAVPAQDGEKTKNSPRQSWLRVLIWILILSALARPQWIEPPVTKTLPTRDLLLLVDLSGSMKQQDFVNDQGVTVDRLSAVKEVLGKFLERREGDRVALVVFGDAPYLQAPFSTDLKLSRQLLDECEVGMAGPRTAFGDAIGLGVNLFDESDAPAKTMIALTDGNDTKSQVPPVEAARVAAERGIRVHTIAMGDPTTVGEEKLDEEALREVAAVAGGSYFFAADRRSLSGIYEQLDQIETREVKTVSHRPRRDVFYWLLSVALLLSLAEKAARVLRQSRSIPVNLPESEVRVNGRTGQLEITP